jgi:carbon-monoxide dehydrogenase medium subunit
MRLLRPAVLVDIEHVGNLDNAAMEDGALRVGAMVRQADERLARHPLLAEAIPHVGHFVTRNRGTVCGSVAHADPAGELPLCLALLGGSVRVLSARGEREIAAADFFLGPLETSLAPDELATGARFRRFPAGTGTAFAESARRHGDYALAGVAAAVTVADGVVTAARASFVSVTDVPTVLDLTDLVGGREPGDVDWSGSADAVRAHIEPDSDIHASADYRRMLAAELARRVLSAATTTAAQEGATRA